MTGQAVLVKRPESLNPDLGRPPMNIIRFAPNFDKDDGTDENFVKRSPISLPSRFSLHLSRSYPSPVLITPSSSGSSARGKKERRRQPAGPENNQAKVPSTHLPERIGECRRKLAFSSRELTFPSPQTPVVFLFFGVAHRNGDRDRGQGESNNKAPES